MLSAFVCSTIFTSPHWVLPPVVMLYEVVLNMVNLNEFSIFRGFHLIELYSLVTNCCILRT